MSALLYRDFLKSTSDVLLFDDDANVFCNPEYEDWNTEKAEGFSLNCRVWSYVSVHAGFLF